LNFIGQSIRVARVLIAIVFVLNAIGVVDQTIPPKEMMGRGVPAAIVPWFMLAGRTLEFITGFALVLGVFRLSRGDDRPRRMPK